MMYYFLLFIYILVVTLILMKIAYKSKKMMLRFSHIKISVSFDFIWVILLSLPFIYLATYRDLSIGTDTSGVYRGIYYQGYAVNKWKAGAYEGLYILFVRLSYWLKQDYRFLLLVTSGIICVSFSVFILKKRRKINPTIALACFFVWIYCFSLNLQRQALAVTVCLLVLLCLEKKRPVIAGVLIIVASFIHITSLIMFIYFIPYIWGKNEKLRGKLPYLFFFGPVALPIVISLVMHISLFSKFSGYVEQFSFGNVNSKFLLFPLLMLPLVLMYWNKLIVFDEANYLHLCGYICTFSAVFFSGYLWYAFRMMYYFIPSEIVILGQLEKCCMNKKNKIFINAYIILALIVSFLLVYVFNDTDSIYPYILAKWE